MRIEAVLEEPPEVDEVTGTVTPAWWTSDDDVASEWEQQAQRPAPTRLG